jgi:hypothetical protein
MQEEQYEQESPDQYSERLQVLGSRLQVMVLDAVSTRGAIEDRWIKDMRQYQGEYEPNEINEMRKAKSSSIFANLTRNKTNAAEARLSDMLFPTDDRNWGIRPTPVPELSRAIQGDDPQQKQTAHALIREAKERAEAMTKEIDDQLTESSYPAIGRDVIHDACVFGTGVMKGPVVVGRTNQQWKTDEYGNSSLSYQDDFSAGTQYVDLWNFYPESSATKINEAEHVLERHFVTRKQLITLARNPNYLADQIQAALDEDALNSQTTHNWNSELRAISGLTEATKSTCYEMWEYNGPINKDDLIAAGAEIEEDNSLVEYFGTILVIGNRVIRASVHPMDTQEEIYRVFNWEKDRSCIFGFGVPYLMRNPQAVINACMRMILDNGGLSAGPQIVFDEDAIEPLNGQWELAPRKLWKKKKTGVPVREAFEVYQINNNQAELMNIFQMARQLADEETNLPLIAQGEQSGHITKTAHGMDMLMNSANIVLRRAVKNFDDDVTRPHITAYYNWNMQFNENPEIKGDFNIDARGSSALLAREMQAERLMTFGNLAGSNPKFDELTDWEGTYKEIVKALQVSSESVMLPPEKVQENAEARANQPPPIDPLEQMKLQVKQAELQMKQEIAGQELSLKQQEMQNRAQIDMANIASREQITIAQLKERTGLELQKDKTKRDIAAIDMNIKQADHILKEKNMQAGYDSYS